MVTAAQLQMQRHVLGEKISQSVARIDWWEVANCTLGTIGFLTFGLYSIYFAGFGGLLWLWAIPYGVLALLCGGYAVYSAKQIIR